MTGKELLYNIIKNVETIVKEISYNDKNKVFIILSMLIDRLSNKEKILILKYIVQNYYNTGGKINDPYMLDIIEYFNNNLIYKNRDIYYNKKFNSKDKIIGFTIDKKYYCYSSDTHMISECSTDIKDKINISKKMKELSNKNSKKIKYNKIYGFMEKWKNENYIFKIYDGTRETGALTLEMKKSKRSEIKGKRCETFKSKELQTIIKNLNIKINSKNIKNICRDIEYILRKLEIDKYDNKKWFKNSLE